MSVFAKTKSAHTQRSLTKSSVVLASLLGATLMLSACGGEEGHEPVDATQKVEEAAEIAKANAPKAEDLNLDTADSEATDEKAPEAQEETAEPAESTEPAETEETEPAESKEETETELSATAGKDLYDKTCSQCHEKGLLSAPIVGNKDAWADRIVKGKEVLATHSAEGFKGMPPQAINGVTVEQVEAAVEYMIEQSS